MRCFNCDTEILEKESEIHNGNVYCKVCSESYFVHSRKTLQNAFKTASDIKGDRLHTEGIKGHLNEDLEEVEKLAGTDDRDMFRDE